MTTWHAAPEVLGRFATAPESLDDTMAASVEAHLLRCGPCRAAVAVAAESADLASSWAGIADRIDRPRLTVAEWVLRRFLPANVARVVAATPALRLSWLGAVAAVVAAAVVAARHTGNDTVFLALAPLLPLAGVALSFGPAPDPAGEFALATPLYGVGLVLRRTVAVLATSIVVLSVGTLALPGLELRDTGWVLPALGLTFGALALSSWVTPFKATGMAAAGWLATLEATAIYERNPGAIADSALFGPAGQLACAVIVALTALTINARRLQLSIAEGR